MVHGFTASSSVNHKLRMRVAVAVAVAVAVGAVWAVISDV